MVRSTLISFAFSLLLSTFCIAATSTTPELRESAVRAHLEFLADDLLEGRGTGAPGGLIAAHYITAQLKAMKLKGAAANGSFYQPVSLVGVKADPKTTLKVSGDRGEHTFRFGDDFVAFTGAQLQDIGVNAELVFVGYGIDSPQDKWNDYKGAPSLYEGKILVILVNDPPATPQEPNLFGGRALTYKGRWTYKFEEAARRGAIGAILLHTDESAGYPWSVVRTSNGSWRYDIARTENDKTPYLPLRAWVTDATANQIIGLAGRNLAELRRIAASRDFKPFDLGLKASIHVKSELKKIEAPNVIGILEGKGKDKSEAVLLTAHWDHLGVGEPDQKGDRIYNGAVDNASGVAGLLEVAHYFSELPLNQRPKRSLIFLFPTAEEQGLLGAEWYAAHPLFPLSKTVAELNIDVLNVLGPTKDITPLGADRSTLNRWTEKVAKTQKLRLSSESRPEQGSYFRSDHFPLAKAGVPAISLEHGDEFVGRPANWGKEQFKIFNETHYHQPSDEYQASWDMRGGMQMLAFLTELAQSLANSKDRPRAEAVYF